MSAKSSPSISDDLLARLNDACKDIENPFPIAERVLGEAEGNDNQVNQYHQIQANEVALASTHEAIEQAEKLLDIVEASPDIQQALEALKTKSSAQLIVEKVKTFIEAQEPALRLLLKEVVNNEGSLAQAQREQEIEALRERIIAAEQQAQQAYQDSQALKKSRKE